MHATLIILFIFAFIGLVLTLRAYFWRPAELPPPYYPDMQFIEVDGFRVPYIQRGWLSQAKSAEPNPKPESLTAQRQFTTKPHLVLVHGLAGSMYAWRHLVEPLSEIYQVTAFDLPGFGDADKHPDRDYSLDQQTERLQKILDHFQLNSAYVVAHSMGAALSLHLSRLQPTRFKKMILIAPALYPEIIVFNPDHFRWLIDPIKSFIVTPRLIDWLSHRHSHREVAWESNESIALNYYRYYHQQPQATDIVLKHFALLKDPRPSSDEPVNTPTLILYSRKDRLVKFDALERFLQRHPNIRAQEDADSAHQMMEEHPSFVLAAVKNFF